MEIKYYEGKPYNRFIVLSYSTYYPSGGLSDSIGDFETLEEAESFMEEFKTKYNPENLDLFDRIEGKYVDSEFDV